MATRTESPASALSLLLAISALASLLLSIILAYSSLLQNDAGGTLPDRRQLFPSGGALARFFDPKSVEPRRPGADDGAALPSRRSNCQVIYVLGVEGSIHHGFMPVIRKLGESQIDFATGTQYRVVKGHDALRSAIFGVRGLREDSPPLDDPELVRSTVEAMCPPAHETWRRHVIIEGNSFPSGGADDTNLQFRVRRQRGWIGMTPEEIASDWAALNHPTNLYSFYESYSPHVDVRFVALHRPYLETIASHIGFDSGAITHSNVISGYLILLSRFLDGHRYSNVRPDGVRGRAPLWTTVCADKLSARRYDAEERLLEAREHVTGYLADFLGWPVRTCPRCFDEWKESGKGSPEERMGEEAAGVVRGHAARLEGIWPPRRREDSSPEQRCSV